MSQEEVRAILRKFQFEDIDMASRAATHWLSDHLTQIGPINRPNILSEGESPYSIRPGNMYFFSYNPLTKSKLPFYDMFPVAIAMQKAPGGFIGLNLHYLRFYNRAVFLNFLIDSADRSNWYETDIARLLLDYTNMQRTASMAKHIKGAIKRYYFRQFLSQAVMVQPKDWKVVPFLPLDRFVKATREEVFRWASQL
jgi:hypothetical protein